MSRDGRTLVSNGLIKTYTIIRKALSLSLSLSLCACVRVCVCELNWWPERLGIECLYWLRDVKSL